TALVVGLGPADAVAGMKVERSHLEQPQRILLALRPEPAGAELEPAAALVLERHALARGVGLDHAVPALEQILAALAPVDFQDHSGRVGTSVTQFLAGHIDAGERLDPQAGRSELAVGAQPGLHRLV